MIPAELETEIRLRHTKYLTEGTIIKWHLDTTDYEGNPRPLVVVATRVGDANVSVNWYMDNCEVMDDDSV